MVPKFYTILYSGQVNMNRSNKVEHFKVAKICGGGGPADVSHELRKIRQKFKNPYRMQIKKGLDINLVNV